MYNYLIGTKVLAFAEQNISISQQLQPSMAGLFIRSLLSLAVIVLLTYLVLRFIKKQQSIQQKIRNERKGWIRIYDYQALGANKGLYLLELLSEICVVGVTENGINILKEIKEDSEEWLAIKEILNESEEIIPPGLTKFFKSNFLSLKKVNNSNKNFQEVLNSRLTQNINKQLERTRNLHNRTTKGAGGRE